MWIVALALRRPYTFVVMAMLIIIMSAVAITRTSVDIFPDINIPVVAIVWQYGGLSPQEMTDRIVSNTERGLTTMVNDIEHIDSQSMTGRAVEKIFFQPSANVQTAVAQVTAAAQMMIRNLPQGTQPPVILIYSSSSVPIIQLGFSSHSLPEQDLNDI
ncbi:MAG: efflux RND transporter permease subunit, partial [Acidobacteria bacterium]|nr:efflux RND transporter permease subunit [Acidobacteriota bacterium]